ncbi:MAG: hypothetical protein ACFFDN_45515 [Candidatus Hodarchaeota archaeon]
MVIRKAGSETEKGDHFQEVIVSSGIFLILIGGFIKSSFWRLKSFLIYERIFTCCTYE